jgi:hypothetical protein
MTEASAAVTGGTSKSIDVTDECESSRVSMIVIASVVVWCDSRGHQAVEGKEAGRCAGFMSLLQQDSSSAVFGQHWGHLDGVLFKAKGSEQAEKSEWRVHRRMPELGWSRRSHTIAKRWRRRESYAQLSAAVVYANIFIVSHSPCRFASSSFTVTTVFM